MRIYNLFMACLFYAMGDFVCRFSFYSLYTKFMDLSVKYDEKCGYKIWKAPFNS